jgi:hypothetical protein
MYECLQAFQRAIKTPFLLILTIAISIICSGLTSPAAAGSFTLKISDEKSMELDIDIPPMLEARLDGSFIFISGLSEWSEFYETENLDFPHISITNSVYSPRSCISAANDLYLEPGINNNLSDDQKVVFSRLEMLECIVSILNDDGSRDAILYFWYPKHESFIEISIDGITNVNKDIYNYTIQPIVDSFRQRYAEKLQDVAEAARLVNRNDPSLPDGANNLLVLLGEMNAAQQRSEEAKATKSEIYARLVAKKDVNSPETSGSDDSGSYADASEPGDVEEPQSGSENLSGASSLPSNQVAFTVKNDTGRQLLLKFFEFENANGKSPSRYYPKYDKAWVIGSSEKGRYPLTCTPGRIVCMGAEFDSDRKAQSGVYWGVSVDAREACDTCCLTCGGSSTEWNLTWDGKRNPPQVAGGGANNSANAEALGTIIGTIGGAILNGQHQRSYTPSAPPKGPAWRPSGISK